jgi:predicted nucleic acid-binding protein
MKRVFVDALYWIALINPKDQWHTKAVSAGLSLKDTTFLTSDNVLEEVLNFYCERGEHFRRVTAENIRAILVNLKVEVAPASHERFLDALSLYESRHDKGYSLTDCVSMNLMLEYGITEILTKDEHFEQEGFRMLL